MAPPENPSEFLELEYYQKLKPFPYLKGLLKPFKGKGDFEHFAQLMREARNALNQSVRDIEERMRCPPWTLLPLYLSAQPTANGVVFLRWRSRNNARMGVKLWDEVMQDPNTPTDLLQELRDVECMRIRVNLQVSGCHYWSRMGFDCVDKVEHADAVLAQRMAWEAGRKRSP